MGARVVPSPPASVGPVSTATIADWMGDARAAAAASAGAPAKPVTKKPAKAPATTLGKGY